MPTHGWTLLPFAALMLFSLYRRYRSHIGPQRIRPRRMLLRVVLLGGVGVFILAQPLGLNPRLAMAAGLAAGAALGLLSLRHTRFETRAALHYYVPNIYIGLAVSALLILRIAYRLLLVSQLPAAGGALATPGHGDPLAMLGGTKSLPTLVLLGVMIGYYALYYIGVMMLSRRAVAAAPAPAADAQAGEAR